MSENLTVGRHMPPQAKQAGAVEDLLGVVTVTISLRHAQAPTRESESAPQRSGALVRASLEDIGAHGKRVKGPLPLLAVTTAIDGGLASRDRSGQSLPRTRPRPRACTLSSTSVGFRQLLTGSRNGV